MYILVLDARTEFNTNDQADYWLEHVKAFGNAAPVMLVGNKSDLTAVNLDMNALRDKYSNIVDFYPISCVNQKPHFTRRYELFCADLVEQLKTVGTHQVMFTNNQFKVFKQVRKLSRKKAFLDHEKFDGLCQLHEIGKVGLDQQDFLGLLDSLGEIIHFPDLQWSDAYVLNPRWLTYGVYALLYSNKAEKQQGVLSHADVISILHSKVVKDENGNKLTYPKGKCRFIIDAMSKFKLCYRLPEDNNRFVIPDKLSPEQPDLKSYFDKTAEGTLAFKFYFQGLLPRNVMPNLIVARHREIIKYKQKKQLVWQHGVIIRHQTHEAKARLQVDYHQRSLQLWIQGKEPREYLVILRDEIYSILNAIKGLSVKEYVILPEFARTNDKRFRLDNEELEKITYQSLVEQAKAGQTIVFSDAGNQYYLQKVMGFIMTKKQQKKEGVGIENNFHGDSYIAAQSVGDHNEVSGEIKIKLTSADKQQVAELQESLNTLMQHVQNHDADFAIKANAYAELQQIRELLDNLEDATPETKNKLRPLLTSVKDGSLGALQLAKDIKESEETVGWLVEKATVVSALLTTVFG